MGKHDHGKAVEFVYTNHRGMEKIARASLRLTDPGFPSAEDSEA